MNRKTLRAITVLGMFGAGAIFAADTDKSKAGKVTVIFDHPETFADIKEFYMPTEKGRDALLDQIRQFIETRAASYLGAGQSLEVKFTEIDLAGEFEPQLGPGYNHVRIMKDIYAPRFDLEFKLTGADGKVLSEGKRKLRDSFYLNRMVLDRSEPLCYEKDMLSDWIRDDIKFKARAAH